MSSLLRSVREEPRPPGPPPRGWRDWALVAVLAPAAVLEGALRPDLPWRTASVVLTVALLPTLLWRRTNPLLMVAIAFGACGLAGLLTTGEAPALNAMAFVLFLAYALVRWGSGREAVAGAAIAYAKVVLSVAFDGMGGADAFGAFAILSAAMAAGGALRYRARARQRELEQAKLLERERLARDLHDTVAHHVSAIAIRAQAGLATAAADPDAATDALRVIETEASRTLTEMRAIVRVLRADGPPEAAGQRVGDVAALASAAESGPAVEVRMSGDLGEVPPPVAAVVYRLAQESVTNARRHARRATRIEVSVAADDTAVRLRVRDDGEPAGPRPADAAGYGLAGMRERAGLLGGTCEAGPDPDRGWTVTAVLPRAGWAR
ncbi:sensor histidine kinase [Actinomadura syzygii]|uniref:histidine kinase n=1 Tax=Actinomadura syzygii TaxID=1427538 RepID=A0A5D0TTA1_9ACTN|nr:histidine kinase [Actinomadura syzygii]TYC08963.1 sensor histidine kinase [Actinomadura syzygii]